MKIHAHKMAGVHISHARRNLDALEKLVSSEELPEKGVYMMRGTFGYDVQVDGMPLGMDVAWGQAKRVAELIGNGRPKTDRAGYSAARHATDCVVA